MNRHVLFEATEEGKKLNLTFEQEHNCKLVYKETEDREGYVFTELWNMDPDEEYSDAHIIVPLRSVFAGTFLYKANDIFANIIGSTPDHRPTKSWKQLLIDHGIDCGQCVTDGYFYDSRDQSGKTYFRDFACGGDIIGGHVISGFAAKEMATGSTVLMIPICHNHNSCCTDDTRKNGSGFFMMPEKGGTGIRLTGYLRK